MGFIRDVVCPYCRCATMAANIEHIVPRSRALLLGPTPRAFNDTNTTRACVSCNRAKSDLLPHDPNWAANDRRVRITKQATEHVARVLVRWHMLPWHNVFTADALALYIDATKHGKRGRSRVALLHIIQESCRHA